VKDVLVRYENCLEYRFPQSATFASVQDGLTKKASAPATRAHGRIRWPVAANPAVSRIWARKRV
jgi:hypothetical protein